MLSVAGIEQGIVIDHIKAGNGLKIIEKLGLGSVEFPVVLLMNVDSDKLDKKDIIKIENAFELDLTMLGLIDPDLTVNIIENGMKVKKYKLSTPLHIKGLFDCQNPRCITNHDIYAEPTFTLVDAKTLKYKCNFCEDFTYYKYK
jgi:aspartate carbamoyltransferase regulatory subunit